MSADLDLIRRAANQMRAENGPVDQRSRCSCEDDGETFTDHWFDRSICPEPCGMMHDICCECGYPKGGCQAMADARSKGGRLADSWLAVADLLTCHADGIERTWSQHATDTWPEPYRRSLAVARAFLKEDA